MTQIFRTNMVLLLVAGLSLLLRNVAVEAQENRPVSTLIQNVNVFDGQNEKLATGMSVLVEDNKISKIAKTIKAPDGATVINGGGRTLMPGLIDAHWHSLFATLPQSTLFTASEAYIQIHGAKANEGALMRGFTSVRDVGGNVLD